MAKVRRHKIPYAAQAKILERAFPTGQLSMGHNGFTWTATMTPTPISSSYDIKLVFRLEKHPDVFVLTKLDLAEGENVLPHVYNTKEQHLCLYHRPSGQWHSGMLICDTIVPWTHEWLYFYEFWLMNGNWYGGGIGHGKIKPFIKNENSD